MIVPQISLEEAWGQLQTDPSAVLIDVRTVAEWSFVGIPDLGALGRELRTVEWTSFPTGEQNPNFLAQATDGLETSQPILVLCRSGARSHAAASVLNDHGFDAVNVSAGFEGDIDMEGHRHGGWKDHLPWKQS